MIFHYVTFSKVLLVVQTEEYAQLLAERKPHDVVFFAELAPMEE